MANEIPNLIPPDDDAPIKSTRSIMTPYGEQDENGTDLSLIRELLRLTPIQRLRRMDAATKGAIRLRAYAHAKPPAQGRP